MNVEIDVLIKLLLKCSWLCTNRVLVQLHNIVPWPNSFYGLLSWLMDKDLELSFFLSEIIIWFDWFCILETCTIFLHITNDLYYCNHLKNVATSLLTLLGLFAKSGKKCCRTRQVAWLKFTCQFLQRLSSPDGNKSANGLMDIIA